MLRGARGRTATAASLVACIALAAAGIAAAEIAVPPITLDLRLEGGLRPTKLPRDRPAPAALSFRARWRDRDNASLPPHLASMVLELSRQTGIDPKATPLCGRADLEGVSMSRAERRCGKAEIGRGHAWERPDPPNLEFATSAPLAAFNGSVHGHPGILVHGVFGPPLAPTPFTMAFEMTKNRGPYATVLSGKVPVAAQSAGPLTGFELTLGRRGHGPDRGYLSASCPAPSGFSGAGAAFPLLRLELGFEGGARLSSNLFPSCSPR